MQSSLVPGAIPQGLDHLPCAKQIGDVDFSRKAILIRASTGSGKTMTVPAHEARLQARAGIKPCVILRQPTKLTCQFVLSGLRKFHKDLTIGICTRDKKERIEDADVIIISDGSLPNVMSKRTPTAFYCDEAHWLTNTSSEIEIGVAKKKGIPLRLMTATVDPDDIMAYLGPDAVHYELEGRTYPIEHKVIRGSEDVFARDDANELNHLLELELRKAKSASENVIVFLPTRQMTENAARHFNEKGYNSKFAHGGVNPIELEKWVDQQGTDWFCVFATCAAATGITIACHRSIIADEKVSGAESKGMSRTMVKAMDNNTIIQAAGRAGRIAPGTAYLLTPDGRRGRDPWADIVPEPIDTPCARSTPYDVILTMAGHGYGPDDIDLLSDIDQEEMDHALEWLIRRGCIDTEHKLTKLGRLVMTLPLPTQYAHLVATAAMSLSPAAAAAVAAGVCMGLPGTYSMVKVKPRSADLHRRLFDDPDFTIMDRKLVIDGSAFMSLARLAQVAMRQPWPGGIRGWSNGKNLWGNTVYVGLKDFRDCCKFLKLDKQAFDRADLASIADEVHAHLMRHPLFRSFEFSGDRGKSRGGLDVFFDAVYSQSMGEPKYRRRCWGIPNKVQNAKGYTFYSLGMGFWTDLDDP